MTGDIDDARLIVWARTLLHERCDSNLIGHCERSASFAALITEHERLDVDNTVVLVGTLLHDIGLGDGFAGPERFEARGANAIRQLLSAQRMDLRRAETVWDIIALHATSSLAAHKSAETAVANRAISIDVRGIGHEELPADRVRAILDRWPRHDFVAAFEASLASEVRANPGTSRFCWLESVAVEHVDGYRPSSFLDSLHRSRNFV